MGLVKALLNMLRQVSTYFSNVFNKGAHDLEKHNEQNINLDVVISDFTRKSDSELKSQMTTIKEAKAGLYKDEQTCASKQAYVDSAVESIDIMEGIINDPNESEEKRFKAQGDLKMVRIGASQAIKVIKMLGDSISERKTMIKSMEENLQKNQQEAFQIKLELESLKLSKDLITSAKGMTQIRLNEKYDLAKLKEIVDGEHNLFKASQEVEAKFNSNPQEVVNEYVSPDQTDSILDEQLAAYRAKKAAK